MGILNTLLRAVTWWNSQTLGTQFYTWRNGEKVGEDAEGNQFYQSKENRRWVIFNGEAEASRIRGYDEVLNGRLLFSTSDGNGELQIVRLAQVEDKSWKIVKITN